MDIALWIAQAVLALIFAVSGVFKATHSKDELVASGQTGVKLYKLGFIRFIAICELLGMIGVIVPWLTGIGRVFTPVAAVGLGVIMIGAAVSHSRLASQEFMRRRQELLNVGTTLAILSACVFVAVGRFNML